MRSGEAILNQILKKRYHDSESESFSAFVTIKIPDSTLVNQKPLFLRSVVVERNLSDRDRTVTASGSKSTNNSILKWPFESVEQMIDGSVKCNRWASEFVCYWAAQKHPRIYASSFHFQLFSSVIKDTQTEPTQSIFWGKFRWVLKVQNTLRTSVKENRQPFHCSQLDSWLANLKICLRILSWWSWFV